MAAATRAGPARALPQRAVRAVRACVRRARARIGGGNSSPACPPPRWPAPLPPRGPLPSSVFSVPAVWLPRGVNPLWPSCPSDLGN